MTPPDTFYSVQRVKAFRLTAKHRDVSEVPEWVRKHITYRPFEIDGKDWWSHDRIFGGIAIGWWIVFDEPRDEWLAYESMPSEYQPADECSEVWAHASDVDCEDVFEVSIDREGTSGERRYLLTPIDDAKEV